MKAYLTGNKLRDMYAKKGCVKSKTNYQHFSTFNMIIEYVITQFYKKRSWIKHYVFKKSIIYYLGIRQKYLLECHFQWLPSELLGNYLFPSLYKQDRQWCVFIWILLEQHVNNIEILNYQLHRADLLQQQYVFRWSSTHATQNKSNSAPILNLEMLQ